MHARTHARREHRDMSGSFGVEGPCGKILDTMPIPVKAGQYDWPFLRPAAFVQLLARENPRFGDMLKAVGPRLRLAFYLDEIKPGNILRPDAGRTLCNFYWCFLDLPSWFRARDSGWMLFGCFPYKLVKGVRGGYSFLFGEMLKQFFDNDPLLDFRSGFPCRCAEGLFLCLGDFTMLVSDEKALKEVLMLRGASGTKPCLFCQNVLGHMPAESVENDEYLVHYSNPDRTRFRCHTSESFDLQLQRLRRARDNKKELQRLGQVYGLHYCPQGVLFRPALSSIVKPIECVMYDYMHILLASGGLAQYQLNSFVKRLKDEGIALEMMDAFARSMFFPKGWGKLPPNFFAERVCMDPGSMMKTFAGEVLTAIAVLEMLVERTLESAGVLPADCECLVLLCKMINIFQGPSAAQHTRELTSLIDGYTALFARIYAECTRPKMHWLHHVPEGIERFKTCVACFAPERKHRSIKSVATFVTNDTLSMHVTLRIAEDTRRTFQQEELTLPCYLVGGQEVDWARELLRPHVPDVSVVRRSGTMVTPTGRVQSEDVVYIPRLHKVGQARIFLQATLHSGAFVFLVELALHEHVGDYIFSSHGQACLLVWEEDFRAIPYAVRSCGSLQLLRQQQPGLKAYRAMQTS